MALIRTTEPRGTFRVTYEIMTAESAEQGDCADRGWLRVCRLLGWRSRY